MWKLNICYLAPMLRWGFIFSGYLSLVSPVVAQPPPPPRPPVCHPFAPMVTTTLGRVCGTIEFSHLNRTYFQYAGIPYAEPPVGELRFQAPVPYRNPWGRKIRQAIDFGSECLQFDALLTGVVLGKEDCLFLNIFTPSVRSLTRHPVMVWVHGGGFTAGGSNQYLPRFLMDGENMVVVSMNYRLASLGFLNTGDDLVTGNMGLKDQNMALQFVRDNIANFGGDPNRVTLFGESAGSASVHYHVISPQSNGLFHRAIMQSGNVFCPWAFTRSPQKQAFEFGASIGCPTNNTAVLVDCLKKEDGSRLVLQHSKLLSPVHLQNDLFAPSVEAVVTSDTFLSKNPYEMLKQGEFNQVPVIFGMNSAEGGLKTSRLEANPAMLNDLDTKFNEYVPILLHYDPKLTNVSARIRQYYFPSSLPTAETQNGKIIPPQWNLTNLTQMVTHGVWCHATREAALHHSKFAPAYLNYFTYQSTNIPYGYTLLRSAQIRNQPPAIFYIENNMEEAAYVETHLPDQSPKRFGACHADDLFFYWSLQLFFEYSLTARDYLFTLSLVKTLTDFVRHVPRLTFQLVPWDPVDNATGNMQYMNLDARGAMISQPFADAVDFIDSLNIRDYRDPNNW